MPKYRKKPVVIEARLFVEEDIQSLRDWCGGYIDRNDLTAEPYIKIATLEGIMTASVGNYIIKGIQGEFYPCDPDIFALTYDLAEDEQSSINVEDVHEHADGSMSVIFNMTQDNLKIFAEIGMRKVLLDEAERVTNALDDIDMNVGC